MDGADGTVQRDIDCAALRFTDGTGAAQSVVLSAAKPRLVIGRSPSCDVVIGWDGMVSREHAIIEMVGAHWFISDDGLSTHGTYVDGERVAGRRRLQADDRLLLGHTVLTYRAATPSSAHGDRTRTRSDRRPRVNITPAQERVLRSLCAPVLADPDALPASNQQIVEDLHISVDAVKDHLQELYRKFGVQDLARGEKRIRLAREAVRSGRI